MDKDESTLPIDPSLILPSAITKPKRTKTTHACDLCKKKKVKCNGEHPCIRCQKLAVLCTFTPSQSKWDSSAPYATTQAQRLYALEKALDSLQVDTPAQGTTNYLASNSNDTTSATMASPLDKFNTSSTGKPFYIGDGDTRLDRLPTDVYRATTLSEKDEKIPNGFATSEATTIDFELISIYFGQVHHYFPIVHQESFCYGLNNTSPLLLNAMYAIACQWSGHMDGLLADSSATSLTRQHLPSLQQRNHSSLKYYRDAIALVELYMDAPRLSTIQALLLIIKYQELVRRPGYFPRTHFYLGLVVRMCSDLGLSHVLPRNYIVEPTLAEDKRRVFWIAYVYDLLISTELGTAAHFSVDQCTVEFPRLLDDEKISKEQHDTILYLHWIAKVMKAQGMVLQYLRQKYGDRSYQLQQHSTRHFFSIDQHIKDLGAELATWKGHGGNRFDFVFLAYHFTNILLYRSLSLDLQDKNIGDGTINRIGVGAVASKDSVKGFLLQQANAITNIVEKLLRTHFAAACLHHGFRGVQQLIHYLTAVRTVQLMYRQEDDAHVKELIYHLTTLTPAVELLHLRQMEQSSGEDADVESTENSKQQNCPPLPSSSSPLVNAAYYQDATEYLPQSSAIYAGDDLADPLNNTLHDSTSLTFSSGASYQHQQHMNQNWTQLPQNGFAVASASRHSASLTLDTSALPILYQPSSSSDISPMIPTPLPLNVTDPASITSTTSSSTIHPAIGARRSHQQLRKAPTSQWLSSSTTSAAASSPDLLSPAYSRSTSQQKPSSPAPPPQRLHSMTSRQSSPSTCSLPSSPLHRMTLSDDPGPWIQSTPSLVLPPYPQQQNQHQQPPSPPYIQPYGLPLPPPEDQHHVVYDHALLDNPMLSLSSTLPQPGDEPMNELFTPTSLVWNRL